MRRKEEQFQQLGARIVLVGLGTVEETSAFKAQFHVPFPMIADPEKQLFKAFQLKQATPKALLSVGMAMKGLAAMAKGHGIGIPKGDVRQLPGVFIIDKGGRIRFSPDYELVLTLLEGDRVDLVDANWVVEMLYQARQGSEPARRLAELMDSDIDAMRLDKEDSRGL